MAAPALATPYWIAWEGDDWPENQPGWFRNYGNWSGPGQGGANRTLASGVLTYDSLHDPGVYDFSEMWNYMSIDPGPGEVFVMQWSLWVEQTTPSGKWDASIAVQSDTSWSVGFEFNEKCMQSSFEGAIIPLPAGTFHAFELRSTDMRNYHLWIDGKLARQGSFVDLVSSSRVGWGEGVQGAASLHHWDYVRFGVVPEPVSSVLLIGGIACCCGRRR